MSAPGGRATHVVAALRTPFGRRSKSLAGVHPVDLLSELLIAAVARSGVAPDHINRLIVGCVEKAGEQGFNIARTAWLTAGLPADVACSTIDAQCGSSQEAFSVAHAMVAGGQADVVIAAGVECMTRVPMATTFTSGPGDPIPPSFLDRYPFPNQFDSAEQMAAQWGIAREDCDDLAVMSNRRALAWGASPDADTQLHPIGLLRRDENPRETTPEVAASLDLLAPQGVHTSATASKMADGASAVVIVAEEVVIRLGLDSLARVVDSTLVGVSPNAMLTGPITATRKLLAKQELSVADIDHFEINEAFASVVLAWAAELDVSLDRVNPTGGALAHGHPLGATGTALVGKAVHELVRSGGRRALVSMCCGGGLGTGTLLERP
jgi:acetyl-CoA C-acetyltransferase